MNMVSYSFKLPDLGEGTVESEIVAWRAGIGDQVSTDQPLVDMMTDKATIEITAPVSGELISVAGEPGDIIAVGAELAVFATNGEQPAGLDEGEKGTEFNSVPGESAPAPGRPLTSPAIRRLARENNIDLSRVHGTGPNGRITRVDIDACLDQSGGQSGEDAGPGAASVREIRLQGLRRKTAERMTLSASRIPHFSFVEEVDVTELDRLRRHLTNLPGADLDTQSATAGDAPGMAHVTKLTYLPFFMQALVKVVKTFPQCNAHFDDERQVIRQFDPVHIGIAVQTGDGLMVPVIRHVETLDLWQCSRALREAAEKARNGSATREDLTGSTITITSLGALGGIVSTPIINYPEVAIIGINRTQQRQTVENTGVTTRLVMNISSSFDHRVVDGYDAARVLRALKSYLESPATLFLPES